VSLLQMSLKSNNTQQHEVCTNVSHVCTQSSHKAVPFPVRIQSDIGSVIRELRIRASKGASVCFIDQRAFRHPSETSAGS
jgi:hypothetical protein